MFRIAVIALVVALGSPLAAAADPHHHDSHFDLGFDLFELRRDDEGTHVDVLDLWVVQLFGYTRSTDRLDIDVLDAPLISLFERRVRGEEREMAVVKLPMFALYRSESSGGRRLFEVLRLPLVGSLFSVETAPDRHKTRFLFLFSVENQR